jgi:hypothetical protein
VKTIFGQKVSFPRKGIRTLVSVDGNGLKQCLFIVRDQCLMGVMSFADIMDYLLNTN